MPTTRRFRLVNTKHGTSINLVCLIDETKDGFVATLTKSQRKRAKGVLCLSAGCKGCTTSGGYGPQTFKGKHLATVYLG